MVHEIHDLMAIHKLHCEFTNMCVCVGAIMCVFVQNICMTCSPSCVCLLVKLVCLLFCVYLILLVILCSISYTKLFVYLFTADQACYILACKYLTLLWLTKLVPKPNDSLWVLCRNSPSRSNTASFTHAAAAKKENYALCWQGEWGWAFFFVCFLSIFFPLQKSYYLEVLRRPSPRIIIFFRERKKILFHQFL